MHACIYAYMQTCIRYMHPSIPTLLACLLPHLHTYTITYTYTYTDRPTGRPTDRLTDRPTDIQYNRTQYNAIQYRPDQSRQRPDRDRDRDRQTETDRERQRDRHRDRETERQSERCQRDIQTYGHTDIDTHNTYMHACHALPCLALPYHYITYIVNDQ